MKILVVDDFATMRRIVRAVLGQLGFRNIVEAEDGQAALDKLQEGDVELIIADCNMPRMTGLELLQTVRAEDQWRSIPFLVLTSESQKREVMEAVQSEASSFVVKPFNAEILEQKLEVLLRNGRGVAENISSH